MSHNIKIGLWAIVAALTLAGSASAASPLALEVSSADLTAAGVSGASEVVASGDRFKPPVRYFRSPEKLSAADAKLDCKDCADLISIYAAEVPGVPGWYDEKSRQLSKIGGRVQLRAYIPSKKRIVTVTAASEVTARKISSHLLAKFSR